MPSLKISYTDTESPTTNTITVTLSNVTGRPDENNSSNPLTLKSGDIGHWGYTGGSFTFTVTDLKGNAIPEITNRDGGKALPSEQASESGYTIYINDPKNPPISNDARVMADPPDNGVKIGRP